MIWVRELTRFSRKVMEGERLVLMADRGVKVWSANDEYDLTRAAGRRHFRDDMVKAANESDTISERTIPGQTKAGPARPEQRDPSGLRSARGTFRSRPTGKPVTRAPR